MLLPSVWRGFPMNLPNMYLPSLLPKAFWAFLGFFFLCHGSEGRYLQMMYPRANASTHQPPTSPATSDSLRIFLSSISPESPLLPQKGVTCNDLMPEALEAFADVPKLSKILIQAALALALQRAGCNRHAETLALRLYEELGQKDADEVLFGLAGTPPPAQIRSSTTLRLFLELQSQTLIWHCQNLVPVNGSFLHGKVFRVYQDSVVASRACCCLRDLCAGVATNGTNNFYVVTREGSYLLPQHDAYSWLYRPARGRRSASHDCTSETEQKVHAVVNWIPGVSTAYNLGTTIYFAARDCHELAEERGIDALVDVGQDTVLAVTGGAGSVFGVAISAALKPAVRSGVHSLVRYFRGKGEPYPVPSNHSGPVMII